MAKHDDERVTSNASPRAVVDASPDPTYGWLDDEDFEGRNEEHGMLYQHEAQEVLRRLTFWKKQARIYEDLLDGQNVRLLSAARVRDGLLARLASGSAQTVLDHAAKADREELERLRVIWSRTSGALCDASTVDTDDFEKGIHELTAERDAYRSSLADLAAFTNGRAFHARFDAAKEKALVVLKHGTATPCARPDQDDDDECSNCTQGAYSLTDEHGEEHEYKCEHCNGTGKDVPAVAPKASVDPSPPDSLVDEVLDLLEVDDPCQWDEWPKRLTEQERVALADIFTAAKARALRSSCATQEKK